MVAKVAVGWTIGSVSVMSEAIHSGVDLIAAVIALIAVRTSDKPADEEHSFGHGKIENISGVIEAALIFLAAGWIVYEAVHKLMRPQPMEDVGWGVIVMLASAVVNTVVSGMLFKVARATDSVALEADAWHLRTDVWTSAGVMAGLALLWSGEWIFPGRHFHWIDPIAAIAVALLIVKAAWGLTLQAGRDLIDTDLPAEEKTWIREYLHGLKTNGERPGIFGYHRLRTRKSGRTRFVEFHLWVDPGMSVYASHELTRMIKADIGKQLAGADVLIHIEPYDPKRDSQRRKEEGGRNG